MQSMSNNVEVIEYFGDPLIKSTVEKAWAKFFEFSNKVIRDAGYFGFSGLEIIPDPNIHQMLASLSVVDSALDIMLTSCSDMPTLQYDATKMILNAKQQILNLESVANSLKAQNREDFDRAMEVLTGQAVF